MSLHSFWTEQINMVLLYLKSYLLGHILERQKVMYTRISLSDDPEAIELKIHLEKSVELMGFPEGTDMLLLFSGMSNTIENLKNSIDN